MNASYTVLPVLERLRRGSLLAAGAVAAAMALSPLYVQASNNDSKAAQAQQKGNDHDQKASANDKAAANKAADKAPNEFVSCKRDADGMTGPERSRFMTTCLKERK